MFLPLILSSLGPAGKRQRLCVKLYLLMILFILKVEEHEFIIFMYLNFLEIKFDLLDNKETAIL